ILEGISEVAGFDSASGSGVAMQLNIEDAVGLKTQLETIEHEIEDQL
ncbi:MAG: P-II family nitrogen regulator, partial [Nitrosopumilaceae archaeon]|nr:P-II family nitrogen regulator [Nitrosopumilaceae archaeon]